MALRVITPKKELLLLASFMAAHQKLPPKYV